MNVRRLHTVEEACQLGWDGLVHPDDLFHWSGWLSLERDRTNVPPFYLMGGVGDGAPATSGLSCYPLDATSEPWPFMRVDCMLTHLAKRHSVEMPEETTAALIRLLPTYACGGRRSPDTRVLTVAGADPQWQVNELLEAAEEEAARQGVKSLSLLFVSESDQPLRCVLKARGYTEFPTANYATLPLRGSFQAYLATLPGHRRREVRRERKRLHEAGVRFAVEPLSPGLIDQLVPLQMAHGRKYGHAYSPETLAWFCGLHLRHCGPSARAITARSADGVLRAFSLAVERGRRLFVSQCGFDYEWRRNLPLYFGVVFYEAIEHALRMGATTIDYAIEAEPTKLSRGCVLERRYGYLKILDQDVYLATEPIVRQVTAAAAVAANETS